MASKIGSKILLSFIFVIYATNADQFIRFLNSFRGSWQINTRWRGQFYSHDDGLKEDMNLKKEYISDYFEVSTKILGTKFIFVLWKTLHFIVFLILRKKSYEFRYTIYITKYFIITYSDFVS